MRQYFLERIISCRIIQEILEVTASATSNLSKKTLQINFRLYLGVFRGFKKREDFFVNCGERSSSVYLNKTRLPGIRLKGAFNE